MTLILEWIRAHDTALWWLAAASVVMFVGSLIAIPIFVARIPADYFSQRRSPNRTPWQDRHPVVRAALLVAKNVIGCVFIVAGIAMLVLPGQGLLTIVIGILLLDFPGKYALERWLVSRPSVLGSINWLRRRANQPPLELEP